mmetsp:Transcript_14677/g.41874  ORF Transcript_14677/g.41874 Transcript_14677/m.41874 type:complete len:305 (-) Transcript_14677:9-923(-)
MVRLGLASFVGTTRRHDAHHVLRHSTLCCSAGRIASTRRTSLFTLSFLGASHLVRKCGPGGESAFAAATYDKQNLEELVKLFNEAIDISKGEEFAPADESWTKIIDFAPDTSAAWSNRGTFRLQRGKWSEGLGDLEKAIELEGGVDNADGYLTNNYANALGATGQWDEALRVYKQSAELGAKRGEPDLQEIAEANYALGLMQTSRDQEALEEVRSLLRKDPNFLDMRAAEAAILWALRDESGAETAWSALQTADEGGLYAKQLAIARVQSRWPPRVTAALSAFITVQNKGNATDYDGKVKTYQF